MGYLVALDMLKKMWENIQILNLSQQKEDGTIINGVQTVYIVTSNTLVNREHLRKIFKSHTTSNEIIAIMGPHVRDNFL